MRVDDLEIKVITLLDTPDDLPIVRQLRTLFPNKEIVISPGVLVKTQTNEQLYKDGVIGLAGLMSLAAGHRKWHHEIPGRGAVGCFMAHRNAMKSLSRNPPPLLVLEDDCVLDMHTFVPELTSVLNRDDYDVAVFGAKGDDVSNAKWKRMKSTFCLYHCVLYTPAARLRLPSLLQPIDMQIEYHLSLLSMLNEVRIIVHPGHAKQNVHLSMVQEAPWNLCALCDMTNASMWKQRFLVLVAVLWLLVKLYRK